MSRFHVNLTAALLLLLAACTPSSEPVPPRAREASTQPARLASSGWSTAYSLIEGKSNHTATLLPDGSVLVAGGDGGNGGRRLARQRRAV